MAKREACIHKIAKTYKALFGFGMFLNHGAMDRNKWDRTDPFKVLLCSGYGELLSITSPIRVENRGRQFVSLLIKLVGPEGLVHQRSEKA
ncbi:MAG TPA: hypothetical protein DIV79_06215 [Opitutae bacterium]|nr:hypothetical protein [Opitutaceae bacterium]HCR29592.1 hypothetical protein [Opitutae bacterium]